MSKIRKPPPNPMDKKIPRNPRYADVTPTVDTGASVTRHEEKLRRRSSEKPKAGELFKRIKCSNFVRLAAEDRFLSMQMSRAVSDGDMGGGEDVEELDLNGMMDELDMRDAPVDDGDGSPRLRKPEAVAGEGPVALGYGRRGASQIPGKKRVGDLNSILTGEYRVAGEKEKKERGPAPSARPPPSVSSRGPAEALSPMSSFLEGGYTPPSAMNRYLLLDVRTPEEFDQCHIETAINYPQAMLSRATNYFSDEIRRYMNHAERLIIVYDNDDRGAARVATVMYERGVNNIAMLVGGLKEMVASFETHVVGDVPPELRTVSDAASTRSRLSSRRSDTSRTSEAPSTTRTDRSISLRSVASDASSVSHGRAWR